MSQSGKKGIAENWDATGEEINEAMGRAIYRALREHKRAGVPVATMRDGKVVLVPPEEIVLPPDEELDEVDRPEPEETH